MGPRRQGSDGLAVAACYAMLSEVGKYDEAEEAGRRFVAGDGSVELQNALGEVLERRGKRTEAEAAFRAAMSGRGIGRPHRAAQPGCPSLRSWRARRGAEEPRWLHRRLQLASALADLRRADGGGDGGASGVTNHSSSRTRSRRTMRRWRVTRRTRRPSSASRADLEKYKSGEAKKSLEALLQENPRHPRALLASARVASFDGSGSGADLVGRSLEVNPKAAPACLSRLDLSGRRGLSGGGP